MFRTLPRELPSAPTLALAVATLLFAVVLAFWTWSFLHAPAFVAVPRPAPPPPIDASAGATLFGAQPQPGANDQVQLLGILAFDASHAAAVVSVGGQPARVVRLNGPIADATTLGAVHAHSIVIERNGIQHEISLPATQDPGAFVR